MAITSFDGFIASAKQYLSVAKTAARTSVAASWFSVFDLAGKPGAGVLASTSTAAGVVPTDDPGLPRNQVVDDLVARLQGLVDRIGLGRTVLRDQLLVTPTCGLAGAGDRWGRTALAVAESVAEGVATL